MTINVMPDPRVFNGAQWTIVTDRLIEALSSPDIETRREAIGVASRLFSISFGDEPGPLRDHMKQIVGAVSLHIESDSSALACDAAAYASRHAGLLNDRAPTIRRLIALIERGEIEPVSRGAMALSGLGIAQPSGYAGLDADVLDAVGAALARGGLTRKEAVFLRACVPHAHAELERSVGMMDRWSLSPYYIERRAAARGLFDIGWKPYNPDPDLLAQAAAQGVPILIRLLDDRDEGVRMSAASTLSRFGPLASGATDALIARLTDPDPDVRVMAIRALGEIGRPAASAVPPLVRILNGADPHFQEAARQALLRIRPEP